VEHFADAVEHGEVDAILAVDFGLPFVVREKATRRESG
jgi:hypothetical protein